MSKFFKKVFGFVMGIFNLGLGVFISLQFLNLIEMGFLHVDYVEGITGLKYFGMIFGFFLILLLIFGWVVLLVLSFNYYLKAIKTGQLFNRFFIVTAIEFFLISLIIILYQFIFPIEMLLYEKVIIVLGIVLGSLLMYVYNRKSI